MSNVANTDLVKLLRTDQAAGYLSLSVSMLAKLRCLGGGPSYIKLGRAVRYPQNDLDEWLAARRVRHSSDAARLPARLTEQKKGQAMKL